MKMDVTSFNLYVHKKVINILWMKLYKLKLMYSEHKQMTKVKHYYIQQQL